MFKVRWHGVCLVVVRWRQKDEEIQGHLQLPRGARLDETLPISPFTSQNDEFY